MRERQVNIAGHPIRVSDFQTMPTYSIHSADIIYCCHRQQTVA